MHLPGATRSLHSTVIKLTYLGVAISPPLTCLPILRTRSTNVVPRLACGTKIFGEFQICEASQWPCVVIARLIIIIQGKNQQEQLSRGGETRETIDLALARDLLELDASDESEVVWTHLPYHRALLRWKGLRKAVPARCNMRQVQAVCKQTLWNDDECASKRCGMMMNVDETVLGNGRSVRWQGTGQE